MTDLEMTRLCAEALDLLVEYDHSGVRLLVGNDVGGYNRYDYDPLHDDAQTMALEDWLIERGVLQFSKHWLTFWLGGDHYHEFQFPLDGSKERRRRAICECVAKMQKPK